MLADSSTGAAWYLLNGGVLLFYFIIIIIIIIIIIYLLMKWQSAIIFMSFSTAFLIDCFFILRANLPLIASNGVLLPGVGTLYIILDT